MGVCQYIGGNTGWSAHRSRRYSILTKVYIGHHMLLNMMKGLRTTLDNYICVVAAIMDISIAFYCLPHNRLVTNYLSLSHIMPRDCHNARQFM